MKSCASGALERPQLLHQKLAAAKLIFCCHRGLSGIVSLPGRGAMAVVTAALSVVVTSTSVGSAGVRKSWLRYQERRDQKGSNENIDPHGAFPGDSPKSLPTIAQSKAREVSYSRPVFRR